MIIGSAGQPPKEEILKGRTLTCLQKEENVEEERDGPRIHPSLNLFHFSLSFFFFLFFPTARARRRRGRRSGSTDWLWEDEKKERRANQWMREWRPWLPFPLLRLVSWKSRVLFSLSFKWSLWLMAGDFSLLSLRFGAPKERTLERRGQVSSIVWQAVNKDLTSSSKFSGSCVLTSQTIPKTRPWGLISTFPFKGRLSNK